MIGRLEPAGVLLLAARIQIKSQRASPALIVNGVVQPIVLAVITLGLGGTRTDRTGLVIGIALVSIWGSTLWTTGTIMQHELWGKTLAANLTAVHPPWLILVGKAMGSTVVNTVIVTASTVGTARAFGAAPRVERPVWFAAAALLTVLSAVALGVLVACVLLISRHGDAVASLTMYVVMLLGGAIIPIVQLPGPLASFAYVISLYWSKNALTAAAAGRIPALDLAALAAATLGYAVLSWIVLNRAIDRNRGRGTLDLA